MLINEIKTKELLINFWTETDIYLVPVITVHGKVIERVDSFTLLGVVVSSHLSWHAHLTYTLKKVSTRICCINYSAHAGITESDIIQVYISIVRSVLEHA